MFEEAKLSQNALPLSPRKKACMRQCRIATVKAEFEIGDCPCEEIEECIFGFLFEDESIFKDIQDYWEDLRNE